MIRSQARHRTTPWIAGTGPSSTTRARKALCSVVSLAVRRKNPGMYYLLRQIRRAATELALQSAIKAARVAPVNVQRSVVGSSIALAGRIPMLRSRVRENMQLALGDDVPYRADSSYFHHVGWPQASSLITFNSGIGATSVLDEVKFDESVQILDDAVAEGRGVVLVSPHWSGHELVAAVINRRYPMVFLVRGAATSRRFARKLRV